MSGVGEDGRMVFLQTMEPIIFFKRTINREIGARTHALQSTSRSSRAVE